MTSSSPSDGPAPGRPILRALRRRRRLRALSPAVNDPTTATQAIDAIDDLLTRFADRDIDVGRVRGTDDALRVVLVVPTWEDYLGIVDEVTHAARDTPVVTRRLARFFDDIAAVAPPERQAGLTGRRQELEAAIGTHPGWMR